MATKKDMPPTTVALILELAKIIAQIFIKKRRKPIPKPKAKRKKNVSISKVNPESEIQGQ